MLGALGVLAAIFFELLAFVLNVLFAIGGRLAGPVRAARMRLERLVRRLSQLLTPTRAMVLVVAGASILLGLSQFADYRSIAIGTDAYAGVRTIAPPPEVGREAAGAAHAYVFVPVAALCLLALVVAIRTRRPQLCRLIALAGIAAIVVGLLVDRPAGLDLGETELSFEGARANLLGGFYAQLAAGLLMTCSALLLERELSARLSRSRRRQRADDRDRAAGRREGDVEGARA